MKIYKKCPCCGKTMFLMLGSDFGNEIEFGSVFGNKDNIPHQDTNHEEDWECLNRFLTCLDNSHGKVFISLKDKEKNKVPEKYKEGILGWTEGGVKKEGTTEPPKEKPKTEESKTKTLKEWYESKKITYQDYKLLTTPWTEGEEWDYQREVVLDDNTSYSWAEIQEHLKKAKLAKQKEEEKKRKEQEIDRKMKDGKDWSKISSDFRQEGKWTYKKNWVACGFTYQTCKEWVDISLSPSEDADFAFWLQNKKRMTPHQVLNSGDVSRLREEYESTLTYFG